MIMGILERLFGREKESISFRELERWLTEKNNSLMREATSKSISLLKSLEYQKQLAKDKLITLKTAELFNKNITEREKQIMEGNRTAYIQKVSLFLERIASPKAVDLASARSFVDTYTDELSQFTHGSERAYYMLSEFFQNEVTGIARNIKEMDKLVARLNDEVSQLSKALEPIEAIKSLIEEQGRSAVKQKELKKQEQELSSKLSSLSSEIKKQNLALKHLEKSQQFRELSRLGTEMDSRKEELKELGNSVSEDFSVLDRALRKYSKLSTEEKAILPYFEDPVIALVNDTNLNISEIMEKMRSTLIKGDLGLKDKKQEKTLQKIDTLSREYLRQLQEKHRELREKIEELANRIQSDPIHLKFLEFTASRQEISDSLARLELSRKELSHEIGKIDLPNLKQTLKEHAESLLGIKLIMD